VPGLGTLVPKGARKLPDLGQVVSNREAH